MLDRKLKNSVADDGRNRLALNIYVICVDATATGNGEEKLILGFLIDC